MIGSELDAAPMLSNLFSSDFSVKNSVLPVSRLVTTISFVTLLAKYLSNLNGYCL